MTLHCCKKYFGGLSLWWKFFVKIINDFYPLTIFLKKLHHREVFIIFFRHCKLAQKTSWTFFRISLLEVWGWPRSFYLMTYIFGFKEINMEYWKALLHVSFSCTEPCHASQWECILWNCQLWDWLYQCQHHISVPDSSCFVYSREFQGKKIAI